MACEHNRSWFQFRLRTLLVLHVLIAAYFASYAALMQRMLYVDEGMAGMVISGYHAPGYKFADPVAGVVFWPAAWLDQKLRPSRWGPCRDPECE